MSTPDDRIAAGMVAADVPLVVEDLLTQLDDLRTSDGDPVLIGELWAHALELLRR